MRRSVSGVGTSGLGVLTRTPYPRQGALHPHPLTKLRLPQGILTLTALGLRPCQGAWVPKSWRPAKYRKRDHAASPTVARADGLPDPLDRLIAAGFPVVPAAAPRGGSCSCDRVGCPT